MRVFELAKELGFGSKEFVEMIKGMGVEVKSHMSAIDADTAELIRQGMQEKKDDEIKENILEIDFPITVKDFAVKVGKKPSEIITLLMKKRLMVAINQNIPDEKAQELAYELGFTLAQKKAIEEVLEKVDIVESKDLKTRAPIVTIMGHIDHGKTTLVDYIRKSNVAAKESGGITQHISVYSVHTDKGMITFVDTPGHETFSQMRSRGANLTDIVILVVAGDDGFMPQTDEALSHAKAAGVPIIIAINKIDKENINIDKVKQQLAKRDMAPEDWGGKTICCPISGLKGTGVPHLLDMVLLQAEMMELKADYVRPAVGVVVESKISQGLGPVASVIVRQGVLKVGDMVVCGTSYGKVRTLRDDRGQQVREAVPSQAVEIVGLSGVASSGDTFIVVPGEKEASDIVSRRVDEAKSKETAAPKQHMRLEDLFTKIQAEEVKTLNVIIKADTFGTLEAIEGMLAKVNVKEVEINIMHKGVGAINMSDVTLAEASDAIIFGFKVAAEGQAGKYAQQNNLQIKTYQVIYELTLDLKAAIEGLLEPDIKRVFAARARVKQVFNLTKYGIIAGSYIEKGDVMRNQKCTITRGGKQIYEGKIDTLKRFKDDVREVKEGFECGIGTGFKEYQVGDIIETFNEQVTTKRIEM
jgi:translation initiation factor IF-2